MSNKGKVGEILAVVNLVVILISLIVSVAISEIQLALVYTIALLGWFLFYLSEYKS